MARVTTPESFTASHHAAVTHTTAMIEDEAITKEKIKAAAGIEYSKLALTGMLLLADIKASEQDAANKLAVYDASKRVADSTLFGGLGLPGIRDHTPVVHHDRHESGGADAIAAALALAAIPTPLTGKVITDITSGLSGNRPAAGNVGKIYAETDTGKVWWDDGTVWQDCKAVDMASLAEFLANAGTGTATNPANLNNNDTATAAVFDAVNEYVEVDFGKDVLISACRYYGYTNHVGDGLYMIQYWDGSAWVNHAFDIPTRTNSWSGLIVFKAVITSKVRVVAMALDTYDNSNHAGEWIIIGDGLVPLTVPDFQANPATGTCGSPEDINDNSTISFVTFNAVGQYAEIVFPLILNVKEFRYYGYAAHVKDGYYKIQHWDGDSWVDNTVDIPTRNNTWSDWASLTTPVMTTRVRIVATALDSGPPGPSSRPYEFEMRG